LYITGYYVNDVNFPITTKMVTFTNLCSVMSCNDYSGCYTGIITYTGNTYKDRSCTFEAVTCDDNNDCTKDVCIPTASIYHIPGIPPACIHRDICDESNEGSIIGNCLYTQIDYFYDYKCNEECYSNNDCEEGGICYENPFCSNKDTQYCYWDYYGFDCFAPCHGYQDCPGGHCISTPYCYSDQDTGYCYWDVSGFNCQESCTVHGQCGDGACHVSKSACRNNYYELEEENSESRKKLIGGFTSAELGGIIAGCIGFVVVVIVAVVIYKKLQQEKFNEDTIATLQVPLN